jgi:hypothetical protein
MTNESQDMNWTSEPWNSTQENHFLWCEMLQIIIPTLYTQTPLPQNSSFHVTFTWAKYTFYHTIIKPLPSPNTYTSTSQNDDFYDNM